MSGLFSYVNVAKRAPTARRRADRTFCGLTKLPLPKAPRNAGLVAGEEGKRLAFEAQGPWGGKGLRLTSPHPSLFPRI